MINGRQFYINDQLNPKINGWLNHTFSNGYTLHYHRDLKISVVNQDIAILGHAWQVDPNRDTPIEELRKIASQTNISQEEVYEIEKSWCGRYLLIIGNNIYLDAIGSLGVFFSNTTISSSLNVLCIVEERSVIYPHIIHGKMPDFYPGMQTPYKDVRRLLPSQILNYTTKICETRPLLIDKIPNYSSFEEGLSRLSPFFIHSMQGLAKEFPSHDLFLALTGGRDSRVSMSILEKAGVEYNTFTLWHQHITPADLIIPKRLAKLKSRKYRYVKRNPRQFSALRHQEYKIHTAGMAVDEDWQFYSFGQYQALCSNNRPVVILRSGGWELTCEYYRMLYGERSQNIEYIFPRLKELKDFSTSVKEWIEFVNQDIVNKGISNITRVYWDLREGCWLSSIEQSFDLMDNITSIQPLNCRLLINLALGFDINLRLTKQHENLLSSAFCPEFNAIPFDYQYRPSRWSFLYIKTSIQRRVSKLVKKLLK